MDRQYIQADSCISVYGLWLDILCSGHMFPDTDLCISHSSMLCRVYSLSWMCILVGKLVAFQYSSPSTSKQHARLRRGIDCTDHMAKEHMDLYE